MKYQLKEERQINRFPKMPLWYDKDMVISLAIGIVIGILLTTILL